MSNAGFACSAALVLQRSILRAWLPPAGVVSSGTLVQDGPTPSCGQFGTIYGAWGGNTAQFFSRSIPIFPWVWGSQGNQEQR
jgi:hypothetical protein